MTKDEAMKVFFKRDVAGRALEYLMKWDAEKTLYENGKVLGKPVTYCGSFASTWGLKYKRVRRFNKASPQYEKNLKQRIKLLQEELRVFLQTKQRRSIQ